MADRRIAAKGTGSVHWHGGHLCVRVSLPNRTRPRYRLCKAPKEPCTCNSMSDAFAEDRGKKIAADARARIAAEIAEREALTTARKMTVQQLGDAWTEGELLKAHGKANKLRDKASASEDGYRLAWAYRVPIGARTFGDVQAADVTEEHAQRVMALAPRIAESERGKSWRPATELQLYQALHRLFELAAVPCRLRPRGSNPFTSELRPVVPQGDKLFQWLYPDELLAVLRTKTVPLARRVLYALAVYTGQRKDSLRALRWRHVDFDHGVLTSPKQKNGIPLTFDVAPDLLVLLGAWREHGGIQAPAERPIFRRLGCRWSRLAEQLRDDLKAAGVTRGALQGDEEHEEPLRFHDLRATMVVWALKDPAKGYGWATDRTGHLTPSMLKRYDRAARNWREAKIVPFPALGAAVPEFTEQGRKVVRLAERSAG